MPSVMTSAVNGEADNGLSSAAQQLDLGGPSRTSLDAVEAEEGELAINGGEDDGSTLLVGQDQDQHENENGREPQLSTVEGLQAELIRLKDERDSFEAQYHGLLSKLGQMRSTLGDRLRQDAEELDKREQQIDSLTGKIEELNATVSTLEAELLTSHEEVERLSKELDSVRAMQQASSTTTKGSELRLREVQEMAERYRIEAESWESACMEERAYRDEIDLQVREARRERDEAQTREREQAAIASREQETAAGLQQVLEEFQAGQESELQRAVGDHEEKLIRLTTLLGEHQTRTDEAEEQARTYKEAAERCQVLEKDIKEKNLLVGRLRHEAVILNEHLTESLRRLRANTSDSSVDGKLISNLLIQFLNTPRSDTKRFEMLNLIASVLNWSIEEREKAGLQRNTNTSDRRSANTPSRDAVKRAGSNGTAGHSTNEESFSNLFVEFLLSEAEKAKKPDNSSNAASPVATPSTPQTPRAISRPSFNLGSLANLNTRSSLEDVNSIRSPTSEANNVGSPGARSIRSP
jgi:hypothetical protein